MLTPEDINFIKANRSDITQGRTETVVFVTEVPGGEDPYTGEPLPGVDSRLSVDVVWKEYSTVANSDRSVVGGVELQQDDVKMTVESDIDINAVSHVERGGRKFIIISVDERGIGEVNRYECVVRAVI
jgi:hypothetical protein